ncbi:unnamed protein product [Schistocephalus solidus]|uniref:C2H2-type domain-containing protein n=1 Tax=Schistocephalus solidus TaxID=70667 RepID=A0A183SVS6_SCHSO|nr:unnamed protein product [Schistocephalus solidus]
MEVYQPQHRYLGAHYSKKRIIVLYPSNHSRTDWQPSSLRLLAYYGGWNCSDCFQSGDQDPTTTTIRTNDNNFIDAPPPTITDTILPPPPPAPITATNNTCATPTTLVASSDYLTPATFTTTTAPSTSNVDSILTCPHCDHTFTSHIDLAGHLQIHRTENGELVPG